MAEAGTGRLVRGDTFLKSLRQGIGCEPLAVLLNRDSPHVLLDHGLYNQASHLDCTVVDVGNGSDQPAQQLDIATERQRVQSRAVKVN